MALYTEAQINGMEDHALAMQQNSSAGLYAQETEN